jgi:transcription initiation factor TFIID TATA-box-binding protein
MDEPSELVTANIVASGELNLELDLTAVAEDFNQLEWIEEAEHSRRSGNRLLVRFKNNDCLSIVSPSGVYIFTGADDMNKVEKAKDALFSALSHLSIISEDYFENGGNDIDLSVQNIVFVADLAREINLEEIAVLPGFENIEYEPEQFLGLVYMSKSNRAVLLVYSTGKVVITGVTSSSVAEQALSDFTNKLEQFEV